MTRALLRRKFQVKSPVIEVGPLSVSTADRVVKMNDRTVELTAREYALRSRRGLNVLRQHGDPVPGVLLAAGA